MADLISMLPSDGENFTDLINSGEFSLDDFIKEDLLPRPTIVSAPAPDPKPTQDQPQKAVEPINQPSISDQQELKKIEELLLELGAEIKKSTEVPDSNTSKNSMDSELSSPTNNPPIVSSQETLVDQMLQEPLDVQDTKKVEVVSPSPGVSSTPQSLPVGGNVINQNEFNSERLIYLKEMEKNYLDKRQEILNKYNSNFQSTELTNQSFAGDQNSEFNDTSVLNNTDNTTNTVQNAGDVTNLSSTENFFDTLNKVQNNQNETLNVNNLRDGAVPVIPEAPSIQSDTIPPTVGENNIPENNVENIFTDISNTNINNTTDNNTSQFTDINESVPINEPGAFTSQNLDNEFNKTFAGASSENIQSELPPASDPVAGNAQEIIKILQGIQTGIGKLGETLGSKFSNLDQSIKNVSTTVNNYNNMSRSQGAPVAENNNTSQRTPMPDYRGDYAQSSDFPPGFDVSNMGGKNLGNIPQIA